MSSSVTFAGNWDSTWGRMELAQEGLHVHGTFVGYREGSISGELDGDILRFRWSQQAPRQNGRGYLQISPDGVHLEGRWGYIKNDTDGGRWAADRDATPIQ